MKMIITTPLFQKMRWCMFRNIFWKANKRSSRFWSWSPWTTARTGWRAEKVLFWNFLRCAVNSCGQALFNLRNNALPALQHNLGALRRRTIDGSVLHLRMSEPKLCWTEQSHSGRLVWTSKHTVTKIKNRGYMPKCLFCTRSELWL